MYVCGLRFANSNTQWAILMLLLDFFLYSFLTVNTLYMSTLKKYAFHHLYKNERIKTSHTDSYLFIIPFYSPHEQHSSIEKKKTVREPLGEQAFKDFIYIYPFVSSYADTYTFYSARKRKWNGI